jgi:hypothetical protein
MLDLFPKLPESVKKDPPVEAVQESFYDVFWAYYHY